VAEGHVSITYGSVAGSFADDEEYELLKPAYEFKALADGPLDMRTRFSPRIAPATFGLGLLEAIPERQILAGMDPEDRDSNGISGRPNYVFNYRQGRPSLGRFGWKANQPTVEQQVLKAFDVDLGITSAMFPDSPGNARADSGLAGHELSEAEADTILFYMKLVAVPMRRNWNNSTVLRGKAMFSAIGCIGCHTARFTTGEIPGFPELSNQTIYPYTDLLLHDMGEDLADHRPDGLASGSEWRTAPLWGIGLVKNVNGHTRLLHDGRARTISEAILWHGGEAAASRESYRRLAHDDRAAIVAFLESL
jgi:CxxC motif-containing protein (DUF1111 family)